MFDTSCDDMVQFRVLFFASASDPTGYLPSHAAKEQTTKRRGRGQSPNGSAHVPDVSTKRTRPVVPEKEDPPGWATGTSELEFWRCSNVLGHFTSFPSCSRRDALDLRTPFLGSWRQDVASSVASTLRV